MEIVQGQAARLFTKADFNQMLDDDRAAGTIGPGSGGSTASDNIRQPSDSRVTSAPGQSSAMDIFQAPAAHLFTRSELDEMIQNDLKAIGK